MSRANTPQDVWKRVKKGAPDECWPWMGSRDLRGYGHMGLHGSVVSTHRVVMLAIGKELGKGAVVMHKCDNPPCCNPAHLRVGTHKENKHDCMRKGRMNSATGSRIHNAVIDEKIARRIRALYKTLPKSKSGRVVRGSLAALRKRIGVSKWIAERVVNGSTWKHI